MYTKSTVQYDHAGGGGAGGGGSLNVHKEYSAVCSCWWWWCKSECTQRVQCNMIMQLVVVEVRIFTDIVQCNFTLQPGHT